MIKFYLKINFKKLNNIKNVQKMSSLKCLSCNFFPSAL